MNIPEHKVQIRSGSKATPWGPAQFQEEIIPGLNIIQTASHGGLQLSQKIQAKIPDEVLATFINGPEWAEEDCEACLVEAILMRKKILDRIPAAIKAAQSVSRNFTRYHPAAQHLP